MSVFFSKNSSKRFFLRGLFLFVLVLNLALSASPVRAGVWGESIAATLLGETLEADVVDYALIDIAGDYKPDMIYEKLFDHKKYFSMNNEYSIDDDISVVDESDSTYSHKSATSNSDKRNSISTEISESSDEDYD